MSGNQPHQQIVEHLNAQAIAFARSGQQQLAEERWRQALKTDPNALSIRTNLARLYFQQERYVDISNLGTEIKGIDIVPAALAALLGHSARKLGSHSEAMYWLTIALKQRMEDPGLQLAIAELQISNGEAHKAIATLNKLSKLHPQSYEPQLNLAIALAECGQISEACATYDRLLKHWPAQRTILANAAQFHLELGDLDQCNLIADQLLKHEPSSRAGRKIRAELDLRKGNINQAQQVFQQLVEQMPEDAESYLPLIFTSMEAGDWQTAARWVKTGLQHASGTVRTRLLAAWVDLPEDLRKSCMPQLTTQSHCWIHQQQLLNSSDPKLAEWVRWIKDDPSLIPERLGKPTRGGLQSHEILARANSKMSYDIKQTLEPVISSYRQNHEWIQHLYSPKELTKELRISGWSVVLKSGGNQLRHTHPEAIISGVMYLEIPESLGETKLNGGNLWFSPNPLRRETAEGDQYDQVVPKAGLVVVFPAFLPHETIPFDKEGDRICIAFNAY